MLPHPLWLWGGCELWGVGVEGGGGPFQPSVVMGWVCAVLCSAVLWCVVLFCAQCAMLCMCACACGDSTCVQGIHICTHIDDICYCYQYISKLPGASRPGWAQICRGRQSMAKQSEDKTKQAKQNTTTNNKSKPKQNKENASRQNSSKTIQHSATHILVKSKTIHN